MLMLLMMLMLMLMLMLLMLMLLMLMLMMMMMMMMIAAAAACMGALPQLITGCLLPTDDLSWLGTETANWCRSPDMVTV
ncbi:hypothetical protein AK812_SmicGene20048 [Symbiodinium microadriaticum]|uniref:Uncharacterized protein n=1 Tax=Symbiodinium microadriaticum TaxID=2951 RepID=A0A1Q9DQZ3_SYMMI|nr:hypothetical protein AK812_SmicGene20048 [Symbiodinium microadriaticum]